MKQAGQWLLIVLLSLPLGCEYVDPTMNAPLPRWNPAYGYRYANLPPSLAYSTDNLFVVVSFSGGGARASALSYGVLRELARTPIVWEGYRKRLVDEINIINGLSGGSFTAAYYALYHDRIFHEFEDRFLRKDWESELPRAFSGLPAIGSDSCRPIWAVPTSLPNCWTKRCSTEPRSMISSQAISGRSSSFMPPTWPPSRGSNSTSASST